MNGTQPQKDATANHIHGLVTAESILALTQAESNYGLPLPESCEVMTHSAHPGPIFISTAVWGGHFISFFLEFCIPALLAPGNLPAIAHLHRSKYLIHTTEDDFPLLLNSIAFKELQRVIAVDVRFVGAIDRPSHTIQAACHKEAMHEADKSGAPLVFISPDTIWSDQTFVRIEQILKSGKRVIFVPNLRAVKEDSVPTLRGLITCRGTNQLQLTGRDLSRVAITHLHPSIEENFFLSGRGQRLLPCNLIWEIGNGDLLIRSFHVHPLLVFPRIRLADFEQTIDGDLVLHTCPDSRDYHVVDDSDEITCVEFSRRAHFIAGICDKEDVSAATDWAIKYANKVHWHLFKQPARIHANPIEPSEWSEAEEKSKAIAAEFFRLKRRRFIPSFVSALFYLVLRKATGLSDWECKEMVFRALWRIKFAAREFYQRFFLPSVRHPFSLIVYLIVAFGYSVTLSPSQIPTITTVTEWIFRKRMAIIFAFRNAHALRHALRVPRIVYGVARRSIASTRQRVVHFPNRLRIAFRTARQRFHLPIRARGLFRWR